MVLGCADAACNARSGNFLSKPRAISRTTRHADNTDSPHSHKMGTMPDGDLPPATRL